MTPFPLENRVPQDLSRRGFLRKTSLASLGLMVAGGRPLPVNAAAATSMGSQAASGAGGAGELPSGGKPIKLFCCDLNWCGWTNRFGGRPPPRRKTGLLLTLRITSTGIRSLAST